jgi:hypothetical protein
MRYESPSSIQHPAWGTEVDVSRSIIAVVRCGARARRSADRSGGRPDARPFQKRITRKQARPIAIKSSEMAMKVSFAFSLLTKRLRIS